MSETAEPLPLVDGARFVVVFLGHQLLSTLVSCLVIYRFHGFFLGELESHLAELYLEEMSGLHTTEGCLNTGDHVDSFHVVFHLRVVYHATLVGVVCIL
jgi:hypothetical protein